ncbi:hypothetical protein HY379_00680 [Candidatus Saccharibacteria bacterium]|nr:hypothetical protein [Candidatus Saccharibacteria bacterium]
MVLGGTALLNVPALAVRAPARTASVLGSDVSWPQCGRKLPSGQAFGIVGVNGGLATTTNPCLAEQLLWAGNSSGAANQPKTQLYVNTANPGEIIDQVSTWPVNNVDKTGFTPNNPYGQCGGENDLACSWQYGWNRAVEDVIDKFIPAADSANLNNDPVAYVWWLDVETVNTWQSDSSEALARNAAALEGMVAHFNGIGALAGIYSTGYQWGQIVGSAVGAGSNLNGLKSWLAGARTQAGAKKNCALPPLTAGGQVALTQFVSGSYDYDYSCV